MEVSKFTVDVLKRIVSTETKGDLGKKAAKMLDELANGDKVCLLKKALYGLK